MIRFILFIIFLLLISILTFLNIIFPTKEGIILSFVAVVVTIIKFRESFNSKEKEVEKHSGDWTLIATSILYFITGIFIIFEFFYKQENLNIFISAIGVILFLFATFLRRYSIKTLGDQWAIHATVSSKLPGQVKLVDTGIYKYVRHPIYLTYIIDLLSLCLLFNSYHSIILIFLLNIPSYIIRAKKEESESKRRLGKSYEDYILKTWFIFPFF